MKVIKIIKTFRNGKVEHLSLLNNLFTEKDIVDYVKDWCDKESSGHWYGYSYKWEYVEDIEIINSAIKNELVIIDKKIKSLMTDKKELKKYLKNENT